MTTDAVCPHCPHEPQRTTQSCHGRDCHLPGCPSCEAVVAYYDRMAAEDDPAAARLAWYQAALRNTMRRLVRSNRIGDDLAERADAHIAKFRAQRDAVLAIHVNDTSGEAAPMPPGMCEVCMYEWPCPTARALGVTE
jgi:hypothetical protein